MDKLVRKSVDNPVDSSFFQKKKKNKITSNGEQNAIYPPKSG